MGTEQPLGENRSVVRADLQDVDEKKKKGTPAAKKFAELYPDAVIGAFVNKDRPNKKVHARVEVWLHELVTKYSKQFHTSPSAIVREALKEWMRKHGEKV
jgi:hypothetical protein